MKRLIKFLIILIILGGVSFFIYKTFKEVVPYDDTKKLYVHCENNNKSYNILSGDKITFAENDESCKLAFQVRNVDRDYLKLKLPDFYYILNEGTNEINENNLFSDVYVASGNSVNVYSHDKKTKYIFEYK